MIGPPERPSAAGRAGRAADGRSPRDAFFHRLGADGKIGFGESYMAAEWHADDLAGVLTAFAARMTALVTRPLQRLRR